jgi:hypothetical protein
VQNKLHWAITGQTAVETLLGSTLPSPPGGFQFATLGTATTRMVESTETFPSALFDGLNKP